MEISAELLEDTIRALKIEARKGGFERRANSRTGLCYRARIIPYVGGVLRPAYNVPVRDISAEGVGIICSKPLRPGAKFVVCLPRQNAARVLLVCIVRNCELVARGAFAIGASFSQIVRTEPRGQGARAEFEAGRTRRAVQV
jgi:hypothetical protein